MKQGKKQEKRNNPRNISVKTYLFSGFSIFLILAIVVTWFFQVFLLDNMFRYVKEEELKSTVRKISDVLGTDRQKNVTDECALDALISVDIYKVEGDLLLWKYSVNHLVNENDRQPIRDDTLAELATKAMSEGGDCLMALVLTGENNTTDHFFPPKRNVRNEGTNLVLASVRQDAEGNSYFLLLRSPTTPYSSISKVLKRQFFWIAGVLFVVVLVLTFPLSKAISKPLVKMNQAAAELAKGHYNVEFSSSGYRETDELAQTLNYAAGELAKIDGLQKELIANISHDLRTPLTMIRAYGEAMRDIPGENTPENIQVIIDEAERLSELVNDLLDLSRVQSGSRSPVMEFFDLTLAVRETISRYEAFMKNQGYSILFEADGEIPVFADRGMILQVLYNLMNNALNYTGEDLKVTVTQTVKDEKVRISVKDTGEGIPTEQIPLIWDRYYKVDKVHRTARIGTGLGLSIVKGILELHGANFGVNSEIGKGSEFWFELPVSEVPDQENFGGIQ